MHDSYSTLTEADTTTLIKIMQTVTSSLLQYSTLYTSTTNVTDEYCLWITSISRHLPKQ